MGVKKDGEDTKSLLTTGAGYAIIKIIQTGGTIMVKHWVYYPRNFGNEYDVVRTENASEEKKLFDWYDNLSSDPARRSLNRVSIKALSHMCATERHARKYDVAFSGYCCPWEPKSVNELLYPRF